jgi:hypothetical protein
MFRLIWTIGVTIRDFLQRYMPSNILIRATHRRAGLKWGIPAMLVAAVYLVIAAALAQWITDGGPGWLNLIIIVCIWNALKFIINGPITLARLLRARAQEARARKAFRRAVASGYEPGTPVGPLTARV